MGGLNFSPFLLQLASYQHHRATQRMSLDVAQAQKELLLKWIKAQRGSQFGIEHRFESISSVEDFKQAVPIRDYEGHRPYIEKLIAGAASVLTVEDPVLFNLTSGTTNKPKLIPQTLAQDHINAALTREWVSRISKDHPEAFKGAYLALVSPECEGYAGRFPYGNTSGRMYRHAPVLVKRCYALPYEVCEISDYPTRYYMILRFGIVADVSVIVTPNPSTLTHIAQVLRQEGSNLVQALYDGSIGLSPHMSLGSQSRLAEIVPKDRQKAKALDRILQRQGHLKPEDLWPQLAQICCWLGGSVGFQAAKLPELFGQNVVIRDLGYLASEARMSMPIRDFTSSGILAANSNFFEFVPEDQDPSSAKETLLAHELEINKHYHVVVTTASGLYRYDINDLIKVTGFMNSCPEIAFIRKGRDMANITGEKLHVSQLIEAMNCLKVQVDAHGFERFRVWPNIAESRYELALESTLETASILKFLACFDQELSAINLEYQAKRCSGRLRAPIAHVMRQGWAKDAFLRDLQRGSRDIQYKWKFLVLNPDSDDLNAIAMTIGSN